MMLPLIPNPLDQLDNAASNVVKDWLMDLAGKAGQSTQLLLEKTATFWVTGVDTPQLTVATSSNEYAPANTIAFLWAHLHFYVAGLAVFSIILGGIKMVWERNGQPGRELAMSLLQLMLVSTIGLAVISLLINVSDQFASWILKDASTTADGTPTTFQTAFGLMFVSNPVTVPANVVFVILAMQVLFWLSMLQMVLLIIRGGMLFLLAGTLPFAAAAGNTQIGRHWFQKSIAWIIAFILYKPVAAIVYATGFQLTREGGTLAPSAGDQVIKIVTGITMCALAVFALPALMRFTVPAVSAAAGGSSTAGVAALSGAVAMGAKAVGNQGGGSSSSSSGSSQGSTQSSGGGQDGPSGNTGQSTQSTSTQSTPSSESSSTGPSGSAGETGSAGADSSSGAATSGSAGSSAAGSSSGGSAAAGGGGGVPAAAAVGAVAEAIKKAAAAPAKTTTQASGEDSGADGAAPSGGSSSGGASSGSSGPSGSGSQKPKQ
ncbi:hypothetical protein [Kribbella sp. NPDC048928]|uniref:hypothetical protein n=1 Tax=Kribbella sp. NPDC048928 TaxID=3364111 RepID=UPI00371F5A8C